jgi:hypothetical protein
MWTKQPPNTPGFYWLRETSGSARPTVVEVYEQSDKRLVVWSYGEADGDPELLYEFVARRGAEVPEWWSEPLVPPQ